MLVATFISSASPVDILVDGRIGTKPIKVITYSTVKVNCSDSPVYCKIKHRKKSKRKKSTCQNLDVTLAFPFLCDRQTRKLIQRSKVLFIMRGLPGSGKSTIVRAITSAYPSSVVCSADDYFLKDGVYTFDAAGLGSAHTTCQTKARTACREGVSVVVVDNTNVRRWEMKAYLELASLQDYVVVLVQPKTAWRLDPEQLAAKNKHGVDIDTLRRKVSQFDDIIPVFYAWFLPESASKKLSMISQCVLGECVQHFPAFCDRLLQQMHLSPAEYRHWQRLSGDASADAAESGFDYGDVFKQYYTRGSRPGYLLHCTAKFCGSGRAVGAKAYHAMPAVQAALGRSFTLEISSICFSPRTAGARVQLHDSQLPLFDKPEEKDWDGIQPRTSPTKNSPRAVVKEKESSPEPKSKGKRAKSGKKGTDKSKQESEVSREPSPSFSPGKKSLEPRSTKPVAKKTGRAAHITLGCAQGLEARETNFDVLRLCDMEEGQRRGEEEMFAVTGGKARYFGDGVCCVYFDPPLYVRTIYSGFY